MIDNEVHAVFCVIGARPSPCVLLNVCLVPCLFLAVTCATFDTYLKKVALEIQLSMKDNL